MFFPHKEYKGQIPKLAVINGINPSRAINLRSPSKNRAVENNTIAKINLRILSVLPTFFINTPLMIV